MRKDTLRCLRDGGRARFLLMTGCGVPPVTKRENLRAMIHTAKQYYGTDR
ncbi:MAG: hypothetical protein JRJ03_15105 [Deltaproteobacteria bacterium]|nr:hypothetical protein [Deltaproteobacteria bacterium]MBW2066240.1 hypothetical protein [Deltaproteobacteria bacterium]